MVVRVDAEGVVARIGRGFRPNHGRGAIGRCALRLRSPSFRRWGCTPGEPPVILVASLPGETSTNLRGLSLEMYLAEESGNGLRNAVQNTGLKRFREVSM